MHSEKNIGSIITSVIAAFFFFLILAVFGKSQAAGMLKPEHGDQSQIIHNSYHVQVIINNGFARTEIDQTFISTGKGELEAIYSFPLPKEASLSELRLWLNEQEMVGEVLENQKFKGRDTALAR